MKYKLGECIEEIVDKTIENNQYEVLSVTKDGIYSQEEFFKKQIASEDNTGYKIIRKNNLVFSTMNLWMGSLDVLSNYEIGIVSPAYKIFKFDESKMIPSFGKYFMKSHFMLEQYKNCSEQGASVVRRNLDLKQLLDTEIIIPTVEEQCKIVKILENIDEIINKYTNLIKNKEQFIKSQFVEMIDNVTCKKIELEKICNIITKQTGFDYSSTIKPALVTEKKDNTLPFIQNKDFDGNKFNFNTDYFIPMDVAERFPRIILDSTCILFSISGKIGNVGLFENNIKSFVGGAICVCRLNKNINIIPKYILYFAQSKYGQKYLTKNIKAAAHSNITVETIRKLEIYYPDIEEQKKIINVIELLDKQKLELEKQKQNYIELKKGLMQQLLTGKVKLDV